MKNKAFITGITGQDGSFLAEQLLQAGTQVFGLIRRSSSPNFWRIEHILDRITLVEGDILDLSSLVRIIDEVKPQHIYHLASQSYVATSWQQPMLTADVTGLGALRVFEAARLTNPNVKIYQASSSEMFGLQKPGLQDEKSLFHPRSPYGCSKLFAHNLAVNYRESHGLFISCGILFNHESERRGIEFVTRKITSAVADFVHGRTEPLRLGNLDVQRDWGFAGDYTLAMSLMLAQDQPDDFVIATGTSWSLREFLQRAFAVVDREWQDYVVQDKALFRPADIPSLCGDASKAERVLGWKPEHSFDDLVVRMVECELASRSGLTHHAHQ